VKAKIHHAKTPSSAQPTPSLADSFACPSPAISSVSAGAGGTPVAMSNVTSPVSQTSALPPVSNSSVAVRSSGDTTKCVSSNPMANITSSSLADLARGVENLSAQMGMCAGGPFRNVQMQDNESDMSNDSPSGGGGGTHGVGSNHGIPSMRGGQQQQIDGGVGGGGMGAPPRIMNRTSSAGSMQPSTGQHPGDMFGGSSMDDPSLDPRFTAFGGGGAGGPMSHLSGPMNQYNAMGPNGPPGRQPNMNMVTGNAKVQIQAQAPNTIQYMPSNPSGLTNAQPGDNMNDPLMDFNLLDPTKSVGGNRGLGGGGGGIKSMPYEMMHGPMGGMSQMDAMQRQRQMELQMMQEMEMRGYGGGGGPRGQIHPGAMHMGMHQGSGSESPITGGPDGPMNRMRVGDGSPMMGGPMHGMPGSNPMMGTGGHMMSPNEIMQMQSQAGLRMCPGNGTNPMHDFNQQMMMGSGGPMMGSHADMNMGRRGMHPNTMMMGPGGIVGPDGMMGPGNMVSGPRGMVGPGHMGCGPGVDPILMMGPGGGGGDMHSDMAMMNMLSTRGEGGMRSGGGAGGMLMRGGGGGGVVRMDGGPPPPAAANERPRSGRSRQKKQPDTAAAANEARLRNDATASMRMSGGDSISDGLPPVGMGSLDPSVGSAGRSNVDMMAGRRGDMMGMGPGGERIMMRPEQGGIDPRGNRMPQQMRGGGGGGGMMDCVSGMDPMFGFPSQPGRRGMQQDSLDGCPPGMRMCGSPNMGQMGAGGRVEGGGPPGSGGGYPTQFQQFQQQLYAQNRSPEMSPSLQAMRNKMGGPTDMISRGMDGGGRSSGMMGRPIDIMGRHPDMACRPMDGMRRTVDMMNRSMEGMGQPLDNMGRPVDNMGRPVDSMGRPIDGLGRLNDMMLRPVDHMGRPVDGICRPIDPMGRPMDSTGRPIDGMGRPMDPMMSRSMDMMNRPIDGMNRPVDMMGGRPYDMLGNGMGRPPGQTFGPSSPMMNPG